MNMQNHQSASKTHSSDTAFDASNVIKIGLPAQDTIPFLVSFCTHLALIVTFSLVPILRVATPHLFLDAGSAGDNLPEFDIPGELDYSDSNKSIEIESTSSEFLIGTAISSAPLSSDISGVASLATPSSSEAGSLASVQGVVGSNQSGKYAKGTAGVGVRGTDGAIDRITYEILKSIAVRPTTVVWLFDASISLPTQRLEIEQRFDRIYKEVAVATKDKTISGIKPLLTSVIGYGESVNLMLQQPTSDIAEIRQAVQNIKVDRSGMEVSFTAIASTAEHFKHLREDNGRGPHRNVMIIVVTDERGNDIAYLDKAVDLCQRYTMPVYVLGVPAPFGRTYGIVTFVDPHPKADPTPRLAAIEQGPETFKSERLQLGYVDNFHEELLIDSGFGSYSLARICQNTGGIYFSIHPNRIHDRDISREETSPYVTHLRRFFDPEIMARYAPDYLSSSEYERAVAKSPLRSALLEAAARDPIPILDKPQTRFTPDAIVDIRPQVADAFKSSSQLRRELEAVCRILDKGRAARDMEQSSRWRAGYDLAYATANAERIRNETYRHMINRLKRGMKFRTPDADTWLLVPDDEIIANDQLQLQADEVRGVFKHIVADHPGTPWAYLAQQELARPVGWSWTEALGRDLSPIESNVPKTEPTKMIPPTPKSVEPSSDSEFKL